MRTFRGLLVWQKAHHLRVTLHQRTGGVPAEERYGLVQQMRRAAVSIPANITEGHRRKSKQEFLKFLDIAHGSLDEVQYDVIRSGDRQYCPIPEASSMQAAAEAIGRMLNGLKTHVRREVRHG